NQTDHQGSRLHLSTALCFVRNNVNEGFICRTQDQCRRLCNDYRVRFRCPPFFCYPVCWTRWYYLHDLRLGPNFWKQVEEEHPGFICEHPLIQISSTDIRIRAAVTEDAVTFDAVSGFICRDENLRTASCSGYKVRFGCRCCRPPILQTEWLRRPPQPLSSSAPTLDPRIFVETQWIALQR
uniref:WxxW domain-containing protein n=1 Tax=Cynoglossus semilaevis TaxID=244447 RepID=A0A3P8X1P2_CYNSE